MSETKPQRAVTIRDVAREAGVSVGAVSKVMRKAYGVSPAMNERVTEVIERMGYRPRLAARAMRGSTFTIGIGIPQLANQYFTRIAEGAVRALNGTGYQLVIVPASEGDDAWRSLELLSDYQVDGIIAVSSLIDTGHLETLGSHIPLVMIGRHDAAEHYDTVSGDDVGGASLVMDHLIALGHRRIAHLTQRESEVIPGSQTPHALRYETYQRAMQDAGLSEHSRVIHSLPDEHDAHAVTVRLLDAADPPSALFVGNDQLAIGALRAAAERGLHASEFSIAGYDDIELAGYPAISLTTVDQHGRQMGAKAIELLLERVRGRDTPRHFQTVPELRLRTSTAAPT